jgi:anti-sigma B factor antagonist
MDFQVDYTVTDDDIVRLELSGSLDVASAPKVRDLLIRLIGEGHHRLVLQMSAVDFVDSIGLGVFVGTVHRLRPHDGVLVVAAPSAQTRKVFEITQLVRVIRLYDDTDAAIQALRGGDTGVAAPPGKGVPLPDGQCGEFDTVALRAAVAALAPGGFGKTTGAHAVVGRAQRSSRIRAMMSIDSSGEALMTDRRSIASR